jgi:hypothetical protein
MRQRPPVLPRAIQAQHLQFSEPKIIELRINLEKFTSKRFELLHRPLDSVGAEFRQLVAERQQVLEGRRIAIRFDLLNAIPLLDHDARFRRLSLDCRGFASSRKEFASSRLYRSLSLWDIVLRVSLLIQYFDFSDLVYWWFGLSVKALNRDGANCGASEHGNGYGVLCFHG